MNPIAPVYEYQFSLLQPADSAPILMGIAVFVVLILFYIAPYIRGYIAFRNTELIKEEKKQTLANFRAMNEIQTELEIEMKEARIRASLTTA